MDEQNGRLQETKLGGELSCKIASYSVEAISKCVHTGITYSSLYSQIGNHDQNRVSSFYRYGPELADGLNMISLIMPGTTMTYNGDEIGMDNTFITWAQTKDPQAINQGPKNYLTHSRDLTRTPFQWDDSTSAGFSSNKTTWLPVNPNYWHLNLEVSATRESGTISHWRKLYFLLNAR